MLIYACISAHGFGHGSRSVAVLTELAALRPDWRLVLSTALPDSFLRLAMGPLRFERRPCRWDVGVLQADALGADPDATLRALEQLEQDLPAQLDQELAWLQAQAQPVLIMADVPPAAVLLAERLGAPLAWLASFGWEAIYGPMGPAFAPWAQHCRELYGRGTLLLRCPLAMPMDWGLNEIPLGVISSRPRQAQGPLGLGPLGQQPLAERLALAPERQRNVLLCFGGLGLAIDPAVLSRWPEHVFIGPDPGLASVSNGRVLPADCRPLDVMPFVGRMITKPGFSSFCEAFSQGVGLHVVERRGFAEAAVLEGDLRRHGHHRCLSQAAFYAGDWQLDQPLLPPQQGPLPLDGAAKAAAALAALAEGRSEIPIVEGT
jgi:hypothetical protein